MTREEIFESIYDAKANHEHKTAFCTSAEPLTLRKWDQRHPVEENITEITAPAGDTLKIVMASRLGDCGLTDNLDADYGYQIRIDVDSNAIKDVRWERLS